MAKILRVRPAHMGGPCAVYVEELGTHVVPNPAQPYDENDLVVKTAPWMFVSDDELESAHAAPVESVPIEAATRAPGERRTTRRPR
jgi:hypothetical protein